MLIFCILKVHQTFYGQLVKKLYSWKHVTDHICDCLANAIFAKLQKRLVASQLQAMPERIERNTQDKTSDFASVAGIVRFTFHTSSGFRLVFNMRVITLQVVVIVLISELCRANAFWDEEEEDVTVDVSEDDFDHDILDKDEFDLTKEGWTRKQIQEQRFTRVARDFLWIGDPNRDDIDPHDIDLRSDKFKSYREQVKEVLEMDEDEDPEPDLPTTDIWLNEKGEEWIDFYYLRDKEPSSYFWRITSPDGVPSYILGTVRVPYTEVFSGLADNVKKAFEVSVKVLTQPPTRPGQAFFYHPPSLYFPILHWQLAQYQKNTFSLILSDKRWLRVDGYGFEGPAL